MRRALVDLAGVVVDALKLEGSQLQEMAHQVEIADADTRENDDSVFVARAVASVSGLINHWSNRERLHEAGAVLDEERRPMNAKPQIVIAVLSLIHLAEMPSKKRNAVWRRVRRRLESEIKAARKTRSH